MEDSAHLPDTLEELRELERQIEREWWWLHGALNAVAQMHAERARHSWGLSRHARPGARSGQAPRGDRGADRRNRRDA